MNAKERLLRLKTAYLTTFVYPIMRKKERFLLKNMDFSIISDNCWGGGVYQELGRPYTTPFVGLFLFSPDYIKLLKNFSYYLSLDLTFTDHSKYGSFSYPVGLLDDVEIHFLHYATKEEAYQKWTRRKARINYDNLFIKMNDSDQCTNELMTEFDKLPFQHKVFFSAQEVEGMESLIWLKELSKASCIKNGKDIKVYRKYFDVVRWLNQGRNVRLKE